MFAEEFAWRRGKGTMFHNEEYFDVALRNIRKGPERLAVIDFAFSDFHGTFYFEILPVSGNHRRLDEEIFISPFDNVRLKTLILFLNRFGRKNRDRSPNGMFDEHETLIPQRRWDIEKRTFCAALLLLRQSPDDLISVIRHAGRSQKLFRALAGVLLN